MATLGLTLAALQSAIRTALQNANTSQYGQVIIGEPVATEWAEIAAQDSGGAMVWIKPMPGADYSDPNPLNYQTLTPPVAGTTATLSSDHTTLTIGGTPAVGDTIHAFFNGDLGDAYCQVAQGDTEASIATKLAASANSYGFRGITAAANANVVTLSGGYFEKVNVGAAGSAALEVGRSKRVVQAVVFATTSEDREAIGNVILANVGASNSQCLQTADGDYAMVMLNHDRWSDEPADSYTTFRWDLLFDVVHSTMQTVQIAQLGAVQNIIAHNVPATIFAG